jgi:hypothetical protein
MANLDPIYGRRSKLLYPKYPSFTCGSPSTWSRMSPHTLVVLQHGLHGSYRDLMFMKKILDERLKEGFLVHSNNNTAGIANTHEGVEAGGERCLNEILGLLEKNPSIECLWCVGHSLGGIYLRYAIGRLYALGTFERITPGLYVTFVTPHLGSLRPNTGLYNKIARFYTPRFIQQTGKELMLEDGGGKSLRADKEKAKEREKDPRSGDSSNAPLLFRMSEPSSIYWRGLAAFQQRWLYASLAYDMVVTYDTASISPNPAPTHLSTTVRMASYKYICRVQWDAHSNFPDYFYALLTQCESPADLLTPSNEASSTTGENLNLATSAAANHNDHAQDQDENGDKDDEENDEFSQALLDTQKTLGATPFQPAASEASANPASQTDTTEGAEKHWTQEQQKMVSAMAANLNRLSWQRVDCNLGTYAAHQAIVVGRERNPLYAKGREIMGHFAQLATACSLLAKETRKK